MIKRCFLKININGMSGYTTRYKEDVRNEIKEKQERKLQLLDVIWKRVL